MRKKTQGKNVKTTKSHSRTKHVRDKITEKDMPGTLGIVSQAV